MTPEEAILNPEVKAEGTINAWGRNGRFVLNRTVVFVPTGRLASHNAYVDMYSKREGDHAPIHFRGDREQLLAHFQGIVKLLEAGK